LEQRKMKRAAIGVRTHSGWGVLVAVSHHAGIVEVIARQRVSVTTAATRGGNQPYHFAKSLQVPEAEKFLADSFAAATSLALAAVRVLAGELSGQYRVVGAGFLRASGLPLPPLAKILASHALIHAAEGEFFRDVFSQACERLGLPVIGLRERDLDECVQTSFGNEATRMRQQISTVGRSLGPPWTQDQKMSALAALVVLSQKQR
jgi:hypothetical protein